jgi:uncharacterized protein (DUF1800 family)
MFMPFSQGIRRVWMLLLVVAFVSLVPAGCGGGSGNGGEASSTSVPPTDPYRFLMQASFGPTPETVSRVSEIGYARWIDEQWQTPVPRTHLQSIQDAARLRGMSSPERYLLFQSWWTHAIEDEAQLRHRVAFALSEIFVVSNRTNDVRVVASYLDMLTRMANANYRDLLEAVALHPAMGFYLSHLSNRKEDLTTGRVPDENFAREVMQLFSIGLYQLDDSARPVVVDGHYVETYSADDIHNLAKVFTGWGWYRRPDQMGLAWWLCFWRATECQSDEQYWTNMSPYDNEHSTSVKQFLGVTIPTQNTADAKASLKVALDRLATHPNTAPFISKQLIQHLVTSNPSPQYVADITRVFRDTNGNLGQVVRAILLHDEARHPQQVAGLDMNAYGKLREPILCLTHLFRALPHRSDSYQTEGELYLSEETDSATVPLGQTPMNAGSVFNFFRPGYSPPGTSLSDAGLVSPEWQITNETSVLAYANYVADFLNRGWGFWNASTSRQDVQFDLSKWQALATQPEALMDAASQDLLGRALPDDIVQVARAAIAAMPSATSSDLRQRAQAALLMVAVSPDFLIQQ